MIYLKLLLSSLPASLPCGSSTEYPFQNFQPDPELLEEEGLSAAVSKVFKRIFGWQTENDLKKNGPLVLKARGDAITVPQMSLLGIRSIPIALQIQAQLTNGLKN
jgi:hypothetical protein